MRSGRGDLHQGAFVRRDQLRDLWFVRVPHNEGNSGEDRDLLWSALRIATSDQNFGGRILSVDFANGVASLRIGGRRNGAGVNDDEFGVGGRGRG